MPSQNYMRSRARAAQVSVQRHLHYRLPGVWQTEYELLQAELKRALAFNDEKAVERARNSLSILGMFKPRNT